eukprot:TRINITY_DN20413_c0_g1_i1.p2 TRINITY_DN20413_c0_g1~~TRINITY_DN20413_c0_g1_i1.p2  ORF type:complete len:514 (+),score=196.24 TRINITY_DN20413_c0_g1_i1:107-1543(+)
MAAASEDGRSAAPSQGTAPTQPGSTGFGASEVQFHVTSEGQSAPGGVSVSPGVAEEGEIMQELLMDAGKFAGEIARAQKIILKELMYPIAFMAIWIIVMAHCWLYEPVFNIDRLDDDLIPQGDIDMAMQMVTAVGVLMGLQIPAGLMRLFAARRHPVLLRLSAQTMRGVVGHIVSSLVLVLMSNLCIAYKLAPVFIEARTGRRVYPVRFVQWAVSSPSMVIFNFRFLFKKNSKGWRCIGACICIVPCMITGLWGAIAKGWQLFWVMTIVSWAFYFGSVFFFYSEFKASQEDPFVKFGAAYTQKVILFILFMLWNFFGVWYMIAYLADGSLSQRAEFDGYTYMDVILKLAQVVLNMAYDESRWEMRNALVSYSAMRARGREELGISFSSSVGGMVGLRTEISPDEALKGIGLEKHDPPANPLQQNTKQEQGPAGEAGLPSFEPEKDQVGKDNVRKVDLVFQMIPRTQEAGQQPAQQQQS